MDIYVIMNYNYYSKADYEQDRQYDFEECDKAYECFNYGASSSEDEALSKAFEAAENELANCAGDGVITIETGDRFKRHVSLIYDEDQCKLGEFVVSAYVPRKVSLLHQTYD